ncbi:MAG TPA: hypothetical protein VK403_12620, partial [Allosphingosinicella sp.]|nr:hypothetical protein [Allosphingosinicella sp.]
MTTHTGPVAREARDDSSIRILITTEAMGGVWQYSLDLARGLARLGHETVIALVGPAATDEQIRAATRILGLRLIDTGFPLDWRSGDEASFVRAAESSAVL